MPVQDLFKYKHDDLALQFENANPNIVFKKQEKPTYFNQVQNLKNKIISKVAKSYSYNTVQANLFDLEESISFCQEFFNLFKKVNLANIYFEEGLSLIPHVTILYGLDKDSDFFNIYSFVKEYLKNNTLEFSIGKIKRFDNNELFDVLYLEVISSDLKNLNFSLRKFSNNNKYPEYKSHITLAYVQKGTEKQLDETITSLTNKSFKINKLEFGHKEGTCIKITRY